MNKEINYNTSNCDFASYTGKVTVSVYDNDRLIKKTTSHNKGMSTLFNFIGNCLKGDFKSARESRPCKLVLLRKDDNNTIDPINSSNPIENPSVWTEAYTVSTPTVYDNTAMAIPDSGSCEVTYHFRIPSLNLVAGAKVKKLLLLPIKYTSLTEACAYYRLDNEIELPQRSGNITIIVDWTLKFANSTTTSTSNIHNGGDN